MEERVPHGDDREGAYELLQRGLALIRGRHHAQAAVVLERASLAEPNKGSILEALGRACYNSAQYDRARETFERLLELDPSSPFAHFGLGQSLKRLGRRTEARTHLKIAVALEPRSKLYRGALDRIGSGSAAGADDAPAQADDASARADEPARADAPAGADAPARADGPERADERPGNEDEAPPAGPET